MEPSMHSALHGKVYVDALDQELTPVELKKEIDSTKQGIGARIVNAIIGIFRSDSSRVAELKKDIVEFNSLLNKMDALESAKSVDPKKFAEEGKQKDLDDCHSKAEKLGVQINKLWETPSVKALYIQTAVKNAVRDGQTELKELRSKMQEANSKYETMKTETLGTTNSRVNDIENAKKELEGVHKKREALARVLELDSKIKELEVDVEKKNFNLGDLKFEEAADRSTRMADIGRLEREIQELVEQQVAGPGDKDLAERIEVKQKTLDSLKDSARFREQYTEGQDVKQLHSERNRLMNELEKAKGMLAEASAERKTLGDALQADTNIDHQVAVLTDAQMKLAKLDKSRPEEVAMELTKLRSNLPAREIVLETGRRLYADENRYEFQEKKLAEREKLLNDLEQQLASVKERYEDSLDSEEYIHLNDELNSKIELLRKENDKLRDQLQKEGLQATRKPAESWMHDFKDFATARYQITKIIDAIDRLENEQGDFEMNKNALINLIEDMKTAIAEEKGKRSTEFFGDVAEIHPDSLVVIDVEIRDKERDIAEMQSQLSQMTSAGFRLEEGGRETYGQLLPTAHRELAESLFGGLLGQLKDATSNLEQLADEVSGTPAHADVLQLLKDLEAAKKEIPFDMQTILKEKAEGVTAQEKSERMTGDKRLDVRKNNIQKNKAAVAKLVEEKQMAVDELARLRGGQEAVAAGTKGSEQLRGLQEALDSALAELDQAKLMKERSNLRTVSELTEFQEKIDQANRKVNAARDALRAATPREEREVVKPVQGNLDAIRLLEAKIREREDAIRRLDTETSRLQEEVRKLERGESVEERLM